MVLKTSIRSFAICQYYYKTGLITVNNIYVFVRVDINKSVNDDTSKDFSRHDNIISKQHVTNGSLPRRTSTSQHR